MKRCKRCGALFGPLPEGRVRPRKYCSNCTHPRSSRTLEIERLGRVHPDWSHTQIAKVVGVTGAWVGAVLARAGISPPPATRLGWTCPFCGRAGFGWAGLNRHIQRDCEAHPLDEPSIDDQDVQE